MTFVSTAAKGGGSGAGWVTISDVTLGAGTGTWNFVSALPATYTVLRVILSGTTDRAATNIGDMALRVNADATAVYDWGFQASNAAFSGSTATADTSLHIPFWGGATSPAGFQSLAMFDIPFYASSSVNKRLSGNGLSELNDARGTNFGGVWHSNAAITALSLLQLNGANIVAGSRATVLAF